MPFFAPPPPPAPIVAHCPRGSVVSIVAHADDDLYFINPAILKAIREGKCVQTVVTTAGVVGKPESEKREAGLRAAYARMADRKDRWDEAWVTFAEKPVHEFRLQGNANVVLRFLELPCADYDRMDAGPWTSLTQMFTEDRPTVTTSGKPGVTYTRRDWRNVYVALLADAGATELLTLEPDAPFPVAHDPQAEGDGDRGSHPDHVHVAKMAIEAARLYGKLPSVRLFLDYDVKDRPINLTAEEGQAKHRAMNAYCEKDPDACNLEAKQNTRCAPTSSVVWGEAPLCRAYSRELNL